MLVCGPLEDERGVSHLAAISAVLFLTFSARAVAMPHRLKRAGASFGALCSPALLLLACSWLSSSESTAPFEGPCRLSTISNMLSSSVCGLVLQSNVLLFNR